MTRDGRQSVLITGGGGQLASDLEERLRDRCEVAAPGRAELDITDQDAVDEAFAWLRPAVVFNCAAFHNVEVCEREEDRSFEVNARAVKRLAERCADGGARLVHLSTNYVFAGDRDAPYSEDDPPSPRSVYAISKLAGEHAALAYCPDALVVRGSGLYGRHGSASKGGNFVQRMLERAREQGALRMVADQRLTPTYTADLADSLIAALEARCSRAAPRHQLGRVLVARVHRGDHGDRRRRRRRWRRSRRYGPPAAPTGR